MALYRIRREQGSAGRRHHTHHADIYARSPASAMKKAKTPNHPDVDWRWIDSFDTSNIDYLEYIMLGRLDD